MGPMVDILKDILGQLEVVLIRKNELDGITNPTDAHRLSSESTMDKRLSKARGMNEGDIQTSLKLLQKWIVSFAENDLGYVCDKLHGLAMDLVVRPRKEQEVRNKKKKKRRAAPLPSTGDDQENIDDYRSSCSNFFMLETLHLSMVAAVCRPRHLLSPSAAGSPVADSRSGGNASQTELSAATVLKAVPGKVIDYCFEHLDYRNSTAVKHAASLCLSVISEYQLATVVDLFSRKMSSLRGNEQFRE